MDLPKFFRVILDEALTVGKIEIPHSFVTEYGNRVGHSVKLKLRIGQQWIVTVAKHEGRMWFTEGWDVFARYFPLRRGYFAVFSFDEHQQAFNVLIFTLFTIEFRYPIPQVVSSEETMDTGEEEESGDEEGDQQYGDQEVCGGTDDSIEIGENGEEINNVNDWGGATFPLPINDTIVKKRLVYIASAFASQIDKRNEYVRMALGNRHWDVKLVKNGGYFLSAGWQNFMEDNALQLGDICNLQVIDGVKGMISVVLIDHSEI